MINMLMLSLAAIAATWAALYYKDYTRAGEELSKWAPSMGSKPRKQSQKGGWSWTPVSKLKEKFSSSYSTEKSTEEKDFLECLVTLDFPSSKNKKAGVETPHQNRKTIFLDEFRYFPATIKKCSPFFIGKAKMEKTRIHFTPLDMTKSLLCIGPMGSGKTVFFKNLLAQEWYTRALIRCAKGQDFTPVVVDHKRGFALNLYNKTAAIWDVMSEKNFLLMLPPVALDFMVGAVGESKDVAFFANSAADRIKGMFERAYLTGNDSKARWSALEEEMQKFEESVADLNSRENSDVWNNLLLVRETILFWSWRAQESENTFTISDFLKSNKKLVMNGSEIAVKSYYSCLVSAIVQEMLRMPDTETDLTFMLLDEYLTMPLSETTRKQLHTMGRSKGACIVSGLLFLPGDDVAVQQVISSSRFCTILFNVQDKVTSDYFKDYFGEVKHKESEISTSRNKHDYVTGVSSSSQERVSSFLGQEELQKKPAYTHLTILQTEEAYLGYTPQIKMTEHYNPLSDVLDVEPFKRKMHKMK